MDAVLVHLQERWPIYAVVAVLLAPVIYFTRRFTVPLILWTIEVCIYLTMLHLFTFGLVKATVWFKYNTQMAWKEETKVMEPWTVPLTEFWRRDLYIPQWIFWFELVFLFVVIGLILKYRPMRVQSPLPKRQPVRKGVGSVRGSGPGKGPGMKGSSR